jgi:predicted transposase YbfD/YdcC
MAENSSTAPPLIDYFREVSDPRCPNKRHQLLDIIVLAVCAILSGADNWAEVELFGKSKEAWFRQFLALPHGIPTSHTFRRVMLRLNPAELQRSFLRWMASLREQMPGQIVPIDGKTARRSVDRQAGKSGLHTVSAWASASRLVLAQVAVEEKSNEITAIPELLGLLDLSGCTVTIDAIGTQREIAHQILEQGANYLLAVKENQPTLFEEVGLFFASAPLPKGERERVEEELHCEGYRTVEKDHGRFEVREVWVSEAIGWLTAEAKWPGLKSIAMVRSTREEGEKREVKERLYISSLPAEAKRIAEAVRTHWSIENSLHWVLDVSFREDENRVHTGYGQQNLVMLRHLALNLIRQEKTAKASVRGKRLKAGWDNVYLEQVLFRDGQQLLDPDPH